MSKYVLSALTALAALGFAASVNASPRNDSETVSVTISLADLDLSSHAGAQVAFSRIKSAARSVCGEAASPMEGFYGAYRQCVIGATDSAVERLGNPIVAAMNGGQGQSTTLASR
jgi:UrcA family protein